MMQIAFDLRVRNKTGIYRFGSNLIKCLLEKDCSPIKYKIIFSSGQIDLMDSLIKSKILHEKDAYCIDERYLFIRQSQELNEFISNNKIDLYFSINYIVDLGISVPIVATIHDLVRLKFPDFSYSKNSFIDAFGSDEFEIFKQISDDYCNEDISFDTKLNDEFYKTFYKYNLGLVKKCRRIVTPSKTTKFDISQMLNVELSKISVVSNGIDSNVFKVYDRNSIEDLKKLNGIDFSYCLYVGLTHPHKRFDMLLNAFISLNDVLDDKDKLAVIGNKQEIYRVYGNKIVSNNLENRIVFYENLKDDELSKFYSNAQALCVCSLYEGFCLPVLESLLCGTEVIATEIAVLKENFHNCIHYYEINDINELCLLIKKAFNNSLEKKSKLFKNTFSWKDSATNLEQIFLKELSAN